MKLLAKQRLKSTEVCSACGDVHDNETTACLTAARNQDWFHRLSDDVKAEYIEKYPNTKFRSSPKITSLTKKQEAIDFNKNGKVDGEDLKKLRNGKKPIKSSI